MQSSSRGFCSLAICLPLILPALGLSQTCPYETIAGLPATFVGDGVPASEAVFYESTFTLFAPDDSIYISDTGNHRVRRISPDGIIRTVAGDGRPGFGGDGGPARAASLHRPQNLALGPDGSLYIADTLNHRVRRVDSEGVITTVAGNGRFSFSGDGGPAVLAALNLPTSLAFDSRGALFILDSYNRRVRRVGLDGVIQTVAGSEGTDDYLGGAGCFGSTCYENGPALERPLHRPRSIAVGRDDRVYIAEREAVRRIESDGALALLSNVADGQSLQPVEAPTPIGQVRLDNPTFQPAASGDLFLTAIDNPGLILDVESGSLRPTGADLYGLGHSFDRTGMQYAVLRPSRSGVRANFRSLVRGRLGGEETVLTPYPGPLAAGGAAAAGSMVFPRSIAAGADGSVLVADEHASKVFRIGADGMVEELAPGAFRQPTAVAVDSQGTAYVASATRGQIFRLSPSGEVGQLFGYYGAQLPGQPLGIAVDGRDRLYIYISGPHDPPVRRMEEDLSLTPATGPILGHFFGFADNLNEFRGMAVGSGGEVFVGFQRGLSYTPSHILSATAEETFMIVPMESSLPPPRALALAADGRVYVADVGAIWALDPDGSLTPLIGFDGRGFHGEKGFDSAASSTPFEVTGLAVDRQGRVLAAVPERGAVFRFDPSSCDSGPPPRAVAAVESGSFSESLRLAAGTLFSIFGVRLGPTEGAGAQLDAQGRITTDLAGTRVLVNGIPAPILFARADQVNAVMPFDLDGQGDLRIVVEAGGRRSPILRHRIGLYGPSLFSYPDQSGNRRYAAMLNEDGSINSPESPAKLGSIVQLFATGLGALTPKGTDGLPAQSLKRPVAPVKVLVESQEAEILYAGSAPGLVEGVVQINCRLPTSLPGRGADSAFIRIRTGGSFGTEYLFYFKE